MLKSKVHFEASAIFSSLFGEEERGQGVHLFVERNSPEYVTKYSDNNVH